MLVSKRRLELAEPVIAYRQSAAEQGIVELPVDGKIGIAAIELPNLHPDPADRIILATAIEHRATLLTADRQLLDWPGKVMRQDARR